MLEICYFLIAQTCSCRSLQLSCLGQPHGFLVLEKPWVVQSCWKRLSWDWEIDFFGQKTRCPEAPLMPNSRTAVVHYRNSFISLIFVDPWAWYEISLQLWWNKFNWDKTYFHFFVWLYFKSVSLLATFLIFAFLNCRLIFSKTVTRGKFLRSFGSLVLSGQVHTLFMTVAAFGSDKRNRKLYCYLFSGMYLLFAVDKCSFGLLVLLLIDVY